MTNLPNYVTEVIVPMPLTYGSHLHPHEVDGFVPGVSIAVSWTSDEVTLPNGDADRTPDVRGISGCGMWLVHGGRAALRSASGHLRRTVPRSVDAAAPSSR
jgi:hypothetical protein